MTGTALDARVLDRLFAVIESRKKDDTETSYTAKLLAGGAAMAARKTGEEAFETVIAALTDGPERTASESADLLYHLLVLWAASGVRPNDVWAELARREGKSGLAEKAARTLRQQS